MKKYLINPITTTAIIMSLGALCLISTANAAVWTRQRVIHDSHHRRIVIKEKCHGTRHHYVCEKIIKEKHHRHYR